jgi:hypothetical protein
MNWTTISALIARHALTTAGGWFAANGFLPDGTTVESFVGAGMVIAGVAWSWWQKQGHAAALAAAKNAADYWRNKKTAPAPGK